PVSPTPTDCPAPSPLTLHDALPISNANAINALPKVSIQYFANDELAALAQLAEKTMNFTVTIAEAIAYIDSGDRSVSVSPRLMPDRKSTRLNSSHVKISYAVFCLHK